MRKKHVSKYITIKVRIFILSETRMKELIFKYNWISNELLENTELLKNVPPQEQAIQAIQVNINRTNVDAMNRNSKAQFFVAWVWIWATIIFSIIWIRATIMFSK